MLFNRIYKYLHSQRSTPYLNSQLRVWWAKNRRAYRREYIDIMHQVLGANWLNHLQLINIDAYYLKGFLKIVFILIIISIFIYTSILNL